MKNDFILVLGLGVTGNSVVKYLSSINNNVMIYDDNQGIMIKLQGELKSENVFLYNEQELKNVTRCICAPGIKSHFDKNKVILALEKHDIEIISDIDFLYLEHQKLNHNAKYIGITGTNGKSTITSMIAHCLSNAGLSAVACGNIGLPVLDVVAKYEYYVIECSSYNLEKSKYIKFDYSIISNITPDHLDHHGNMEEYKNSKLKILGNKNFISIDNSICREIANKTHDKFFTTSIKDKNANFYIEDGVIFSNGSKIVNINNPSLVGFANQENIIISCALLHDILDKSCIANGINTYEPLKHRCQLIRKIGKIEFINDSKATNLDASLNALSCSENIFLIAGGISKGKTFVDMDKNLIKKIKHIALIGRDAKILESELLDIGVKTYQICEDMNGAIKSCYRNAIQYIKNHSQENLSIVLSPMCASQDMYKNFEERGDNFIEIVSKL
jgi:UDP-N-acetylmuramoylalanine--D-glutamate ligase